MDKSIQYALECHTDVDGETGLLISALESAVNRLPFPVHSGCRLYPARPDVRFKLYFYRPEIPENLIHTYTYQPESNWTTYCPELSDGEWTNREHTVSEDGYVRVAVSTVPETGINPGAAQIQDFIRIEDPGHEERAVPGWMGRCCEKLLKKTSEVRQENDFLLFLLADTHDAVGGIWPDTLQSLRLAAAELKPDALVHLGDFTDGLLPADYTRTLAAKQLSELKEISGKLWCCVGNHDRNYFRGNSTPMSREECAQLYLGRTATWYYADVPEKRLRLLFLDSFDPEEKERYGFPDEEVRWMRRTLRGTPRDYRVLVFSHVPPVASIHVWSDSIRNEERMLRALERFHRRRKGAVLGWIHGHSHADQVYRNRAFPIIGVGCSKLEDFPEHKPWGSVTYRREQHSETQELWDVLLIHGESGGLDFLRFGAGEDRHVEGV